MTHVLFREVVNQIMTTKDLKPIRQSRWFLDLLDLMNWLEVSDKPLTERTKVCVIEPLQDRLIEWGGGFKQLRIDIWRRLEYLMQEGLQ